jgi:hypothetical protein
VVRYGAECRTWLYGTVTQSMCEEVKSKQKLEDNENWATIRVIIAQNATSVLLVWVVSLGLNRRYDQKVKFTFSP